MWKQGPKCCYSREQFENTVIYNWDRVCKKSMFLCLFICLILNCNEIFVECISTSPRRAAWIYHRFVPSRWKSEYKALCNYKQMKPVEYNAVSWCQLCQLLHSDTVAKTYTSAAPLYARRHCLHRDHVLVRSFVTSSRGSI